MGAVRLLFVGNTASQRFLEQEKFVTIRRNIENILRSKKLMVIGLIEADSSHRFISSIIDDIDDFDAIFESNEEMQIRIAFDHDLDVLRITRTRSVGDDLFMIISNSNFTNNGESLPVSESALK